MAFTFGFYNSLNGDRRYNAEQFGEIFDGILRDGVIPSIGQLFAVTTANNGMQINVGTGRAWFDHTWNKNDSVMVLTVPLSDVTRSRYDAVVLEVNANDEIRANSIKIVQGEPLVNPVKPTLVNTAKIHQYPLAYIKVEAGAEVIKASMIENMVGREPTVFATGVLEVVKIDQLWEQWRGEWNDWFDDIKLQLSGNVATNLQYQIDQLKSTALTDSRKATSSEAIAGTNNTKWMTPSTTAAAIDANLGYVKDTYGNKASITVRNPAIITWSKMSPLYENNLSKSTSPHYLDIELLDYVVRYIVVNPDKGVWVEDDHLRTVASASSNTTISVYLEIVRKSDCYYRRVSLGSASLTSDCFGILVCAAVPNSNKIIYNVGPTVRLATVSVNGVSVHTTPATGLGWSSRSSIEGTSHVSKNYASISISTGVTSGCNVTTYEHFYFNKYAGDACITNSGMYYIFEGTTYFKRRINVTETNVKTNATATYTIDIQNYQSSFPDTSVGGVEACYDWVYDRMLIGVQAYVSTTAYYWLALLNGRTVSTNTLKTYTNIDNRTESMSFKFRDISSHTIGFGQRIITYTSSSITVSTLPSQYGPLRGIVSGYGYLTSMNLVLKANTTTFTFVDKHVTSTIEVDTIMPTTNPQGFIGSFKLSNNSEAWVFFKLTNTEYIRD